MSLYDVKTLWLDMDFILAFSLLVFSISLSHRLQPEKFELFQFSSHDSG